MKKVADRQFLISVVLLLLAGVFIFFSASLGLLAREEGLFQSVAFSQIVFGLIGGIVIAWIVSKIHYRFWKRHAFWLILLALILSMLVFVPALALKHGGAQRWIDLGVITVQPSEFLKIAVVLYLSAWYASVKEKVRTFKSGVLPLLILLGIVGAILFNEPDFGTFAVIAVASVGIFVVAGGRFKDLIMLGIIGAIAVGGLMATQPYIKDRINTYFNPDSDPQGSSYQIQQSLIAIGSGQWFGRGLGQSVQKFNFLPEPMGDSIFAVATEEFGFVGGVILILLFVYFAFRGFKISSHAEDNFAKLASAGIIILIITQSFMNIAAMLGVIPLSGLPLLFISKGGTALFFTLFAIGIVLNISKYQKS